MDQPFIGEVQLTAIPYAQKYWADCAGAHIPVNQNPSLYALLGDQFGGDGRTYFMLPDLRGRTAVMPDPSTGIFQGYIYGLENVTISTNEMGTHTHQAQVSEQTADTFNIGNADDTRAFGSSTALPLYSDATHLQALSTAAITAFGNGSAPTHPNVQPTTVLRYVIAMEGLFPSRN